ncbi:MAG: DMT family transporter, partial [Gammaproteobacteria bacterium]|nr:DMT family transporter [Gammaproteobacteria bacterium]
PLVQTYVLLFLTPLIISLLAIPLLGEKVQLFRTSAIIIGLIGVIVVLRPSPTTMSLGHLFGVCAAICSATSAIIARKVGRQENSGTMIMVPMLINVLVTGGATMMLYQPMMQTDLIKMFAIGGLGIIAQYFLLAAYRSAPSYIVAPFQYSQLIWAVIFGAIIFGETIDQLTIVGALITISSGLMIVWRETKVSINQPNLRTRNIRSGALPAMKSFENEDENSG